MRCTSIFTDAWHSDVYLRQLRQRLASAFVFNGKSFYIHVRFRVCAKLRLLNKFRFQFTLTARMWENVNALRPTVTAQTTVNMLTTLISRESFAPSRACDKSLSKLFNAEEPFSTMDGDMVWLPLHRKTIGQFILHRFVHAKLTQIQTQPHVRHHNTLLFIANVWKWMWSVYFIRPSHTISQ